MAHEAFVLSEASLAAARWWAKGHEEDFTKLDSPGDELYGDFTNHFRGEKKPYGVCFGIYHPDVAWRSEKSMFEEVMNSIDRKDFMTK